ncbi:Sulfotransferase [Burkholderiaceae bacterium]
MTVINNKFKFIFVHVPKNAGTSITNLLASFSSPIDIEIGGTQIGELLQPEYIRRYGIAKHSTSFVLEAILGETWNNYFKFAIVRHPYSRFISAFNFLRNWKSENTNFHKKILSFSNINDFISSNFLSIEKIPDNIFNKQTHWICDKNGNEILVDKYIKIEDFEQGIQSLVSNISPLEKFNLSNIPWLNSSNNTDAAVGDILNKTSLDILYTIYKDDFDKFEYLR